MKTLAGYRRVSHVGGRNGDGFRSPEEQAEEIKSWARAHGHRVEMLEPELDGKGDDAERPTFRQAVEGVKAGEYAGVVVAYLSRAGRDLRLMLDLWDEIEKAGGTVFSARENIDASTPAGRLHRNLLASIAQHELEERREGFNRAREDAVERGIWQRRQTPRGYRKGKDRKLVPDRRAASVRRAFGDFKAGSSISELARRLRMTTSGVRHLLRNPVYLGELRVGKHVNPTAHPALVDSETFDAVQERLANGPRPARKHRGRALQAGLARCSSCGHRMTRSNSRGEPIYACPARHSGIHCPAPAAVFTSKLDAYVEPIALAELARLQVSATEGDRVERARTRVADAERALEGFLDAIDGTDVDNAAVKRSAAKRQGALDEAREELRLEQARTPAVPRVGTGAEVWEKLDAHERNDLLRALLAAVVVRPAGRGRKVPMAERVRVLAYGAELRLPVRDGHNATGIVPIPFEDLDREAVLGVPAGEDLA
jgi:DNA invertase Pin-like site-specific DNA recombinase